MNFKIGSYLMKRLADLLQEYALCWYLKIDTLFICYDTYHSQE